jgi:hypothetical protein
MILNITGLSHSGKSLVSDILSLRSDIRSFDPSVEFEFFRIPTGFLDLYDIMKHGGDPIRLNRAFSEFIVALQRMEKPIVFPYYHRYLTTSGHGYSSVFGKAYFNMLTEIKKLKSGISGDYRLDVQSYLFYNSVLFAIEKIRIGMGRISKSHHNLITPQDFLNFISDHVYFLYQADKKNETVLLNNAFDLYSLQRPCVMDFDIPTIIVVRDPRDIWASLMTSQDGYIPAWENKSALSIKNTLWPRDIDIFIEKYLDSMKKIYLTSSKKMIINFERICMDPDGSYLKICSFLGCKFEPINLVELTNNSKLNIGLWRKNYDKNIKKIENSLKEYLYD